MGLHSFCACLHFPIQLSRNSSASPSCRKSPSAHRGDDHPTTSPSTMPSSSSPSYQPHQTTHPSVPPLPSPQTFSILPEIYILISRLSLLQNASAPTTDPQTQLSSQAQSQSTITTGLTQLEVKDLPAEIFPIKAKIVKAREVVGGLMDVERSVAEQEREIEMLERQVRALKGRLEMLGEIARDGGMRDVAMEDGED
jgi:hypothetical protein